MRKPKKGNKLIELPAENFNAKDGFNSYWFFLNLVGDALKNATGGHCPCCGKLDKEPSVADQARAILEAIRNAPPLKHIEKMVRVRRENP